MLVRADEERITGKESFAENTDLLIGAQAGTSNFYAAVYEVLDGDEANPRIKLFDTFGASVQALKSGDVDMVLMDQAVGRRLHRRQSRAPSRPSASRSAPTSSASSSRRVPTSSRRSTPRSPR